MAVWARAKSDIKVTFDADVRLSNLTGESTALAAGKPLTLSSTPVLITGLPEPLIEKARAQKTKPYPWATDYAGMALATAQLED